MERKAVRELTLTDLVPHLDYAARLAIQELCQEQGKAIDELNVDEVVARADEHRDAGTVSHPCPKCGEAQADHLIWLEDGERVRCGTCGKVYKP